MKVIQSIWPQLHEELSRQLKRAGFEVQGALAVDATLAEEHSKYKSESGGVGILKPPAEDLQRIT